MVGGNLHKRTSKGAVAGQPFVDDGRECVLVT